MSYRLADDEITMVWDDEETVFAIDENGNTVHGLIKESGTWISSNGIDFDTLAIPSAQYEAERAAEEKKRIEAEVELAKVPSVEQRLADAEEALLAVMEVLSNV